MIYGENEVVTLQHPIAERFKNGEMAKPTFKKEEFYIGGFFAMEKRVKSALSPFPGAYKEFSSRTEDMEYAAAVAVMRDYVSVN